MFFRRFEALVDIFKPAPDTAPPNDMRRFYAHYLRQVWPLLIVLLGTGFAVALTEVALFNFLGKIVDLVQATPSAEFFQRHSGQLLWMALVALILYPLFIGLQNLMVKQAISPGLTSLIRWQSHRYVFRQSLGFFHNDFAGRIANRIMQTGDSLSDSVLSTVAALWYVCIYAASVLLLFAEADWRLTIPLLVWMACYIGALRYFVPRLTQRSEQAAEASSELMGRIIDGYTNIATLKLFAHSRFEEDYVREALIEETRRTRWANRLFSTMDVAIASLNSLLIVGSASLALWLWSQGLISVGAIALVVGLVMRINSMSEWITWVVSDVFENIGKVQDGMRTIAQPRGVVDREGAPAIAVSRGEVRFERVGFHYDKDQGVIDGLNLVINPGEKIGLVGPSGAGKSTLVNLLLRLYDLKGGRILIDGQDISTVAQDSLRGQVGVVTQDISLLHRSIRDNLLYGKPQATDEELWEALRKARADEFIPSLSDTDGRRGLDAHVGERGVKLSGGQRQRIAIARVLLKNAPILVLDEATSALDSEVEAAIQDTLEVLMEGKTVIAIAHRLSTIAQMDRLVVLDGGRIVESGSHGQLLARGGLYARLWRHQTGGFVSEAAHLQEA
ncbi:ABC transporter ATP-binding protein [Pseudomonas batumici]|uniref:ABC transporter ATP-binding protein n=1 Tax=Pseudomonas batumici TaxID=226910 RepID=UPI0030CCF486